MPLSARLPEVREVLVWALAVAIAVVGGALAWLVGTPLPWLLGAMVATAAAMALGVRVLGQPLDFPQPVRLAFIALIGVAIGGTAEPGMWREVGAWWPSLAAVGLFVASAQMVNYQIFRRLAGYDRPTAFFCATPGGLIESIELGTEAGGDPVRLSVQHFSRIILTVSVVPFVYWALRGEAVGSAAGISLDRGGGAIGPVDALLLLGCAVIGGWGGRRLGLPAAIIVGPILLSVVVHGVGLTRTQPPDWSIAVAQLVIGLGLALRFRGLTGRVLAHGIGFGFVSVAAMLSLGAAIAGALSLVGEHAFQVLFMCFAPGGVVEMGLIALSLGVSPVMVTLHHILRIGFTVLAVPLVGRRIHFRGD